MKPKADLFIDNAAEVVTCVSTASDQLGRIQRGMLAIGNGQILAVGPEAALKERVDLTAVEQIDAGGRIVVPGFIDCHTHLIFGRSRVKEYALKMTRSVSDIEAMGMKTGIPASIDMTREAGEEDLFLGAMDRLGRMLRFGTTTVESKKRLRYPLEGRT